MAQNFKVSEAAARHKTTPWISLDSECSGEIGLGDLGSSDEHQSPGEQPHEVADDVTLFGYVENLSLTTGICGWIAGESPESPPEVALFIGSEEVSRVRPNINRPDIWEGNLINFRAGFIFELENLLPLLLRTDISPNEPLVVVALEASHRLPSRNAWRFCDLTAVLESSQSAATLKDSLHTLPPHLALDKLMRRASRLMGTPRRADPANQQGLIEFSSVLSPELLVVGGWWAHHLPTHASAVLVVEGRKLRAALCAVVYPRHDLDEGFCAFVGVLRLAEPVNINDVSHSFTLSIGDSRSSWLNTHQPLRALPSDAGLAHLQKVVENFPSRHGEALFEMAREYFPWAASSSSGGHLGIHVGVDSFYIAPHFGIFLSGWVISPVGTIVDVSAKLGDAVYILDPMSLEFIARPDLQGAFPGLADRTPTAGFSGVLRGHAKLDASSRWTLRFRFSDNSVLLHELPMERVRVIDHQFNLDMLETTQPNLEYAPWLRDLIDSAYGDLIQPENLVSFGPVPHDGQPLAIHVLPDQPRYARMVLERLERVLGLHAQAGNRVMLVLPLTMPRSLCTGWIGIISRHYPTLSLSTCLLPSRANPWQLLPGLLAAADAKRFAFVGPDVLLTAEGAQTLVQTLANPHSPEGPCFLQVGHVHADQTRVQRDAQAFVWQHDEFVLYRQTAPSPIGGFWACNGMSYLSTAEDLAVPPGQTHALRLRSPVQGRGIDRINRRLLDPASSFWLQPSPQVNPS